MREWTERHIRELIDSELAANGITGGSSTFDPAKITRQNVRDLFNGRLECPLYIFTRGGSWRASWKCIGQEDTGTGAASNSTLIYQLTINFDSYGTFADGVRLFDSLWVTPTIHAADGDISAGPILFSPRAGTGVLTNSSGKTFNMDIITKSPRDSSVSVKDNSEVMYFPNATGIQSFVAWIAPTGFAAATGGNPFTYTCTIS